MQTKKSCIVLSQGPVPAPEHNQVEGGGLRCWGLAKGLRSNDPDMDITIAYHESYRQDAFTDEHESIRIATWNIDTVAELISGFDTVIVSYCMGPLSVRVADAVQPDQQLVLDCNVPIYVEASARDSEDIDGEYAAFHGDVSRWAHVLRRGDVFLCASEAQKNYYKGVLSGIGRINPVTYDDDFIKIVPYGIYRDAPTASEKPITKLLGKEKASVKKILWFGGIYPWFDLRTLVDAVTDLNKNVPAKLIIVGAKNPFNNHPDFLKKYQELTDYISAAPHKDHVILQDWIEFNKRADWYLDSDVVVVVNKLGEENKLAWRTRLVDFMWADLPIITNAGDPLGETLIENGAAMRFDATSSKTISRDLAAFLGEDKKIAELRSNLASLKKGFFWDAVTKELTDAVNAHSRAKDLQKYGHYSANQASAPQTKVQRVRSIASKAKLIPVYARKHGARNTYYVIRTKVKNRLVSKVGMNRKEPGIVMIAHQLDSSGAPYVFMDLLQAILEDTSQPKRPVEFHTFNPTAQGNIVRLNKLGIKPNIHLSKDIALPFIKGDVVVLNTVAHSFAFKHMLYTALENETVKKLVWFVHEDEPELLFDKQEKDRIERLISKKKIAIFAAADKTLKNYQEFFKNTNGIQKQPYKYVIPERFQKVREETDFNKLSFILPGTVGDGRKGQLPVYYAFAMLEQKYLRVNPQSYRDFELVYVGVTDDFLSRQLVKHAAKLFGKKFKYHGRVSHEHSSELMMRSNVTICYSLRESLPLFVFEGMAAGHPILRNDSSGMEEQLFEGKNGFRLESDDFIQVVDALEVVLNKEKTSNKELAGMSKHSNKVALDQAKHSYEPIIKTILE